MDANKKKQNDQNQSNGSRPRPLNLILQVADVGSSETNEIIDLCTPNMDTEEVHTVHAMPQDVVESTVVATCFSNLGDRLLILPLYPKSDHEVQGELLLANIPPDQLTQTQLSRRCSGAIKPAFDVVNYNSTIPSLLRDKYTLFYSDLIDRLHVDMTILDYNYTRLNNYMKKLILEQIQVFNLRPHEIQVIEEKEYPLTLEFFLQFDVNMFYMKTCSFRFARPRSLDEGLFCTRVPEARYELAACGNCGLCYPQYDMTYRLQKFVVQFSQTHKHVFVNGYEAILNCSASCQTRNIIYALTCPCGKFDYIGATTTSLNDRLKKHREHGHRIMHEFLLGQDNILRDLARGKSTETLSKDRMKLYQHSVRCPVAMQIFLDANQQYWRFVPMTMEESERPEQQRIQRPVLSDELDWNLRSKEDCMIYLEAVPRPPMGYTFSNRQIVLQTQYFHKKRDQNLPNADIDLYTATIVAVLPENCSNMFRFTIESLFITHAGTHLNTIGNVLKVDQRTDHYILNNPWLIRGNEWCRNLLRRPQPKVPI